MRMKWLVCVCWGTIAWGQATPAAPAVSSQMPAAGETSAAVAEDAAVITVDGVCPAQAKAPATRTTATAKAADAKTQAAGCKTVITRAEFEKLADAIAPNMTPQLRKQLASVLPRIIAMSDVAKKKGLDKTAQYSEMLQFAKMQILTNALQRDLQEEAAQIPEPDIEAYYKSHQDVFEQANFERLYVPRTKQVQNEPKLEDESEKPAKLSEEQEKAKEAADKAKVEEREQEMNKLASDLQARAAAGEDFTKLQKEAFTAAGMKIESPTVTLPKVRRTALPVAHAGVFDLKAGEVSPVINDTGGHYVYKVVSKSELTLEEATPEIRNKLQSERIREMMEKVNSSFKVETNEAYFSQGGPGAPSAPGMPPPASRPQARPSLKAPANAPAAKPN